MATLNQSHHDTGGVVLFSGELILLYCDAVNCEVDGKGSTTGRIYLTTHRFIFTSQPIKQNANLQSFSAPFYALFDLSLEQPIFGANYIKGKVRSGGEGPVYVFKLKFNKGGAIEFGKAMEQAAKRASSAARDFQFQPPPPYTPSATQYYQAPDGVYQPTYNPGFVLPTQVFNQPPPPGMVYYMEAPPPYPGLGNNSQQAAYPSYPGAAPAYPAYPAASAAPAFSQQNPSTYPQQYPSGYPQQSAPGYPPQSAPGYPQQNGAPMAPGQPPAYPPYPGGPGTQAPTYPAYPGATGTAPPAPGFAAGGNPPTYDEATKKNN